MRVPLATFWWNISISAMNIHLYFVPSTYPKHLYLCARANFKRRKFQQKHTVIHLRPIIKILEYTV